jgi:hypothetical protein
MSVLQVAQAIASDTQAEEEREETVLMERAIEAALSDLSREWNTSLGHADSGTADTS